MRDEEADWKRELHKGWTTPLDVLDSVALEATGSTVRRRSRIFGGEGNEVWSLLAGDHELIARISHRGDDFSGEAWAAEHARLAGAPAPTVLLVRAGVAIDRERSVAVWVHRRLEGDPLRTITGQSAVELTRAAGEVLACVHKVPTRGFGYVNSEGCAPHPRFSDFLQPTETEIESALRLGVPRDTLDAARDRLASSDHLWGEPRLLHGDFLPEHVLVLDSRVTGVIDFGAACSGDPAYDLAYWSFFRGFDGETTLDPTPRAALIEGYRRANDLGDHLQTRIDLCVLSKAIKHAALYLNHGRIGPAEFCRKRFEQALQSLEAGYPRS